MFTSKIRAAWRPSRRRRCVASCRITARAVMATLAVVALTLPSTASATGAVLRGTFAVHFIVLEAHNVKPGPGSTGA